LQAKRDKPSGEESDPYGDGGGDFNKRPRAVVEENPPAIGPSMGPTGGVNPSSEDAVSIGPQMPPPSQQQQASSNSISAAEAEAEGGGDTLSAMEQSRADVLEMLEDDPESDELRGMLAQIDNTIAALRQAA
jgi:hypothetical protein